MNARRRAWKFGKAALPLCAAMFVVPACVPTKPPAAQKAEEDRSDIPGGFDSDALATAVQSLQQSADALPGRTPEAYRSTMAEAFGTIDQVLALVEGAEPSMAFQNESRTLQLVQERLANNERPEQAIDMGLRASEAAFRRLAGSDELSDPAMPPLLARLDGSVDRYGQTPSVGKAYVAADAVRTIAKIARLMSDRLAPPQAPMPTTEPAPSEPAPTTAPAVETPTTEPVAPVTQPSEPPAAVEELPPAPPATEELNK